eukprot:Awhi_evm1s15453
MYESQSAYNHYQNPNRNRNRNNQHRNNQHRNNNGNSNHRFSGSNNNRKGQGPLREMLGGKNEKSHELQQSFENFESQYRIPEKKCSTDTDKK